MNIEVYHLDALLWKPNWEPTTKEEQIRIQKNLIEQEQWIIDGNYNGTMEIRLAAADTIIFLNFNRVLCTYRILKRMIEDHNRKRPDMAEGIEERFNFKFVKWVWDYPKKIRPIVMNRLEKLPDNKKIIILSSPKEAQRFLENS